MACWSGWFGPGSNSADSRTHPKHTLPLIPLESVEPQILSAADRAKRTHLYSPPTNLEPNPPQRYRNKSIAKARASPPFSLRFFDSPRPVRRPVTRSTDRQHCTGTSSVLPVNVDPKTVFVVVVVLFPYVRKYTPSRSFAHRKEQWLAPLMLAAAVVAAAASYTVVFIHYTHTHNPFVVVDTRPTGRAFIGFSPGFASHGVAWHGVAWYGMAG
jgi:hypothetical protein